MLEHVFDSTAPGTAGGPLSGVEHRLGAWLAALPPWGAVQVVSVPGVVVVDLDRRHGARPVGGEPVGGEPVEGEAGPVGQLARLLEEGAGHLDAVADLEAVLARAAAAQVRELAAFARCRPAGWDRQPGETGAASAAARAARPAALEPVSEWAAAEAAARLGLPQRTAQARLEEAVFLGRVSSAV